MKTIYTNMRMGCLGIWIRLTKVMIIVIAKAAARRNHGFLNILQFESFISGGITATLISTPAIKSSLHDHVKDAHDASDDVGTLIHNHTLLMWDLQVLI